MPIAEVRHITDAELAAYRRGLRKGAKRVVVTRNDPRRVSHPVAAQSGSTAYITKPERPGVKREARDVAEALMDRRWAAIQGLAAKSPEVFQQYAEHLRQTNPDLVGHMTDDEIVKTIWRRMNEEATEQAFRMTGRHGQVVIPSG